jgi:hypothetical protein
MSPSSVHKSPFWVLFLYTLLAFLVLIFILEGLARLPIIGQISPYRSVDNYNYQFEIKWFRLQDYVKQNGGVDIIFVGSSLVNTGIDPDRVAKAYFNKTGVRVRMFNFGVEGMTVSPNSVITGLLVKHYHPALIVYVTEMRDYIAGNGMDYETRFLADSWLHTELGKFDPFIWLVNNSAALQHYLPYRNWMRSDFSQTMSTYVERYQGTTASGYEADHLVGTNIDRLPDPNKPDDAANFLEGKNYQISPSRLSNLKTILAAGKPYRLPTAIWVVEMPVHPTFYVFVGGEQVHRQFQQVISSFVASNGGSFLPSEACLDAIPLQGRSNRWHLNYIGAPIFSSCLGEQLALLAQQQKTSFIKMKPAAGSAP